MKEKYILFIYVQIVYFFLSWNTENVRGQHGRGGKVSDLIRNFESLTNENSSSSISSRSNPSAISHERDTSGTSYLSNPSTDLNTNNPFEKNSDNGEKLLSRGRDLEYNEGEGPSYVNTNRKFSPMNKTQQFTATNGDDYDDDSDDYDDDNKDYLKQNYAQDNLSKMFSQQSRDVDDEYERTDKKENFYLGKSFDNFRKNLGLGIDDFKRNSDIYDNLNNRYSNLSNGYDGTDIYEDIQFLRPQNGETFNAAFIPSKLGSKDEAAYQNYKPLNGSSSSSTYNENIDDKYNYAYSVNPIYNSTPSNYQHSDDTKYKESPPRSSLNYRSRRDNAYSDVNKNEHIDEGVDASVHVQSEYSLPVDNISYLHTYRGGIKPNDSEDDFRKKLSSQKEYESREFYSVLKNLKSDDSNNNELLRRNKEHQYVAELKRRNDKRNGFFHRFRNNSNNRNENNDVTNNRIIDRNNEVRKKRFNFKGGKSPSNSDSTQKQREFDKMNSKNEGKSIEPLNVSIFNAYQNNLFLRKILRSASSNPLKNLFKSNSNTDNIISVTKELQEAAEQCISKNKNKLTKSLLMKELAFNDVKLLKNYDYAMSYITVHCNSKNNNTCLDIKPMAYKEEDKNAGNVLSKLPNTYILNTFEFMLSNTTMCRTFKSVTKNKIRDNNVKASDIILLFSNSYFKNVNPMLVNYIINFLTTKNAIYLKKYYLAVMLTFAPFIKPALKIYLGDRYMKTNKYLMDTEIQKIFTDLLFVSLQWTQAFQDRYSDANNMIIMYVYKSVTFSKNANVLYSGVFKSLEQILYLHRIRSDMENNNTDERHKMIVSTIMKYLRNAYSILYS
ncbi:conserved Plasmodium protein, unknown function [Plasmodium malariae]|uniref:Uncharacterized protein n=1 Tax=Plasmodium malariae TaxID=5858 RepID=A0A1C3L3I8_PLAMA|nr:conserved Plasmodium protein, unknown function [Plasmodium malariae]